MVILWVELQPASKPLLQARGVEDPQEKVPPIRTVQGYDTLNLFLEEWNGWLRRRRGVYEVEWEKVEFVSS